MAQRVNQGRDGFLAGLVCLLLLIFVPHPLGAQPTNYGDGIGLRFTNPAIAPIVAEAVDLWRACSTYGHDFPRFSVAEPGFRTVEVEVLPSSLDDRCGDFLGGRIRLYRHAQLNPGRWRSCGSLPRNLAHELGHVLGLSESSVGTGSIMISVNPWTNHSRRVSEADCRLATGKWAMRLERVEPGRGGP